jgi:hypothetical protein
MLVDIQCGRPRSPGSQRRHECIGFDEPGAARVDQERRWLHECQVAGRDDSPRGVGRRMCRDSTSHV